MDESESFLRGGLHLEKKDSMNQHKLRTEYDFSKGERGRYIAAAGAGSNIIRLDPDVAAVFHDAKQVNELLRMIVKSVNHNGVPSVDSPSVSLSEL